VNGDDDVGSTGAMNNEQNSNGSGVVVNRREHARAIYSYLASGDHQLSFIEGDIVTLIGQ
jgi:hypothetical protein